jgi:ParB family transcriptional regulator, chromosome partitioning protein
VSTYSRLGKGLESLIPSGEGSSESEGKSPNMIELSRISVNTFQPRQVFDDVSLNGLSDSIRQYGVVQPILVRPKQGGYELIAGERRFRASQLAGLTTIPAVVKDYTDEESLQVALIENLDRDDLSPIEEALGYKRLIDDFSYSQQAVADSVQKSRSAVANTLRLLNLPKVVQDGILSQVISEGHGRALLGLNEPHLIPIMYKEILKQELSVRQSESRVKALNKPTQKDMPSQLLLSFADQFKSETGMKTVVKGSERKGSVEIRYSSKQELDKLMTLLIE